MILGIDVGYSKTKKTSCLCILSISNNVISLILEPFKYGVNYDINSLLEKYNFDIITMDAPLTPVLITEKPDTGRKVEKLFSKGIFSNSPYRGPQPSTIANKLMGYPLYQAGMKKANNIAPYKYLSRDDIKAGSKTGIYEVIPKMTQSLLLPREVVAGRTCQIDNYLFPLLFKKSGKYRYLVDNLLGEYKCSNELETYIENVRDHEKLASIVCAFQGVLIAIGKANFIGYSGEKEGYYSLPATIYWDNEWYNEFKRLVQKEENEIVI